MQSEEDQIYNWLLLFQHIFAHLVFHHTKKEQEAVLKFIAATTDIRIQNIRRCSVQVRVTNFTLYS